MKFLSVFLLLAVAVCYIRAEDFTKDNFEAAVTACKGEAGASDDDLEALKQHQPAASKEGKCMRACVMKKFGMMDDNGKMVHDIAVAIGTAMIKDEDKKDVAVSVADACAILEVDEDHCEAAAQYIECIKQQLKENGVESEEL